MDNTTPPHSSVDSTTANTTSSAATTATNNHNSRDQYLRHLNKLSHKISKPINPNPTLPPSNFAGSSSLKIPPAEPPLPPPVHPPHQQQQQPPVYNINKNDFRDVVQKLTGSPAHSPSSTPPPPIHAPKPASSRLQRIRPPPLAQLSTRPPPLLNCGVNANPLSPLPPLPTCHAAAESPISAYMRFLHSSVSGDSSLNRTGQMLPPLSPPPMNAPTDATTTFPPFGFLPSPKSPCPMIPPNLMFSPTGSSPLGYPQFPISPTVPGVPSPK